MRTSLINGLSFERDMTENRLPPRPGYHRVRSGEPFANDRERANKARQAAEALFAPKPRAAQAPDAPAVPASRELASNPRGPSRAASVQPEPAVAPSSREPAAAREAPPTHAARIRTWLKYGMTIAEVAEVYGVPVDEIERLLRQA